jgi:ABC-type nitrate/sulfonate/bicarbonate transport system permease component
MAFRAEDRSEAMRRRLALELWMPVALFAAWWITSSDSTSPYFPSLSSILSAFKRDWLFAQVPTDLVPSVEHLAVGLLLAAAFGIALGVAIGLTPVFYEAVSPLLEFLRAIPGVALIPVAVLILGLGAQMKISVIAYATAWPILLNTIDGVRGIDPLIKDVARSYRLTRKARLVGVILPAASPQIIAGIRTSLSLGISVIVFSELVGSTNGIGYSILQNQRQFALPDMWAGMILLGLLGYGINVAFRGFEHFVLAWHRGMRAVARD